MKKIVNYLIDYRYIILILTVILTIASIFLLFKVNVNYNIIKYLPDDIGTTNALKVMNEEFDELSEAVLMIEDVDVRTVLQIKSFLKSEYKDDLDIFWLDNFIDEIYLIELEELVNKNPNLNDITSNLYPVNHFYKNRKALMQLIFFGSDYQDKTDEVITFIRNYLTNNGYKFAMSGTAVTAYNVRHATEKEALRITLLIIPLFLLMLIFFTSNYLDPLIIALTIGVAIIINMGTNAFFPEISFFSQSTVLLLQSAVTMDYAIFLLHRYKEEKANNLQPKEAIKNAVVKSFLPILGSSLTTIAGFFALTLMRYTIGLDMGLVMIKGILLSFMIVFVFMPTVILISSEWLKKTEHKSFIPSLNNLANKSYAWRFLLPIIIMIAIVPSYIYQSNNRFLYGLNSVESGKDSNAFLEKSRIKESFGQSNYIMVLLPFAQDSNGTNLELTKEVETKALNEIKAKMNKLGISSLLLSYYRLVDYKTYLPVVGDDTLLKELLVEIEKWFGENGESVNEVIFDYFINTYYKSQLISNNYSRVIIAIDTLPESKEAYLALTEIKQVLSNYYLDEYHLLGETPMVLETKQIVEKDYLIISIVSIVAIFIILMIMFKSLLIPFLLILVIQVSVWFNMSVPHLMGNPLIFIGYLLVTSIQLGATIDYGILLTNRYLDNRKSLSKKDAMIKAITQSTPAVITSAAIMIVAGLTLAFSSSIEGVISIGTLVSRGAFLSALLVLTFLPQLLFLFDAFIIKKKVKN